MIEQRASTPTTLAELGALSQRQLDELFRQSPAGPIPQGRAVGRAILAPGTAFQDLFAGIGRTLGWRGKVFDPGSGTLLNQIAPFGLFSTDVIKAQVYKEASVTDGAEAIILDYSKTSFVAQMIRDEIREVRPGLYLGQALVGRRRVIDFALSFPT